MSTALTVLYFVLTGIQFWFSDYLITVINIDKSTVFDEFAIVSVTGTVFGVLAGGYISSLLGGYNSKKTMYYTCILAIFCFACALPIPYVNNKNNIGVIMICLWFMLFASGFILPCMTGIMLNTVRPNLRITAMSLANICYNLLGFLPAPFLYELISSSRDGNNKQ